MTELAECLDERWLLSCKCITKADVPTMEMFAMAANALVQARIDNDVKERAAMVLGELGLTISDAVRILLTRTANEGVLPFALAQDAAAHDALFRAKVQAALDDPRPGVPHAEVEAHFAVRRAAALRKA
jgi:DNA-damage-inducible protein J